MVLVYALTKKLPRDEQFGLTSQMRRAAISITSNVAEGFGRKTAKDKEHFYVIAYGSLTELENQLLIAKELGYISDTDFRKTTVQLTSVAQLLNGLLRTHRSL